MASSSTSLGSAQTSSASSPHTISHDSLIESTAVSRTLARTSVSDFSMTTHKPEVFSSVKTPHPEPSTKMPEKCSVDAFYIQLEKVTSQVIQFRWFLQSVRRDSPYTVSLMADNTVINNTVTNDTRMVFGNLSPGGLYTVTVEVLSCSKKFSSSVMVRTEATAYRGTARITNKKYIPQFSNKSSTEFQELQKNVTEEIINNLPPSLRALIDSGKMRITITEITSGSVIVTFIIEMVPDRNIAHNEVERAVIEALNKSRHLDVDLTRTSIEVIPACQPDNNGCSEFAYCIPQSTNYSCECKPGFLDLSPQVPGRQCEDINECEGNNACSKLAVCENTIGSYKCQCYPGIMDLNTSNPGTECQDPILCLNTPDICLQSTACLSLRHDICSSKQAFACRILFKNQSFTPDLYNPESEIYKNMSNKIRTTVSKGMIMKLGDDNFNIEMVGYQAGSVDAYFAFLLQGQKWIGTKNFTDYLTEVVTKMLDNKTAVTVTAIATSQQVEDLKPTKDNSAWKTGVIVLAVLFSIALISIVVMVTVWLYMKKKMGKYIIEPQGPMGKFAFQNL
ncbi:mucin-12 [Podarcis lilfordi]|uniref:Mucin-12 n=2 Tax=Podarcis lilfordi TaxID=74358 RepID=A0AA35P2F6_9SAUR|nr:mucin-12 [Podarcis lilfordi]